MALCSAAISHVAVGERASNDTFPRLGSTLEKGNTVGGSASSLLPRASRSTSNLLLACVPHQIVAADIAPVRLRSSGRVWPSAGVDADGLITP